MELNKKQKKALKKLYESIEVLKKESQNENFKKYINDMQVLNLQGNSYNDLLNIIECHIYPQF